MVSGHRPFVLIVDDGKQHVMLLRLALMQRGYAVVVVHSRQGAETMIRERAVDALLVALPLDAAAEVLKSLGEARPSVAIALLSSDAEDTDGPARAVALGFDEGLCKPIDFAELDLLLLDRMQRRTSGTRTRVVVPIHDPARKLGSG